MAAYGCITLNKMPESVIAVELSSSENIAGRFFYEIETGEISFNKSGLSQSITVTNFSNKVWFGMIPTDLSGKELTIKLTTANGDTYTKTITFANGDGNFQAGRIAKFSVNFADVEKDPEPFKLLEVYKENGVAQGIVFWVSDDGQTAKIVSLDRLGKAAWASANTSSDDTKKFGAMSDDVGGAVNTETIGKFLADPDYLTITSAPYDYVIGKGAGWYWPTRAELQALAAAYNGKSTYNEVTKGKNVSELPEAEREAQQRFDALLIDNGGVALCVSNTGDSYWSSLASSTKAWHVKLGHSTSSSTSNSQTWTGAYTRAIKVVTR